MSYRTILVSLNEIERLDSVLETTSALATAHNSHVVGLYVIPAPAVYPAVGPYVVPEVFDGLTRFFAEQATKIRARFDEVMRRNALPSEWMDVKAAAPVISETVCEAGHAADLIVISEPNRDGKNGVELDFAENVVLGSGRPVLMLPSKFNGRADVGRIVCGYNGSKEAARAIHEAVPLLKAADDVRLVWVDPARDGIGPEEVPGAEFAAALGRHGVKITVEAIPTAGNSAAEALMHHAAKTGAGLIVMGAYGHSRIREYVLGGSTHYALTAMTVPLFMSH